MIREGHTELLESIKKEYNTNTIYSYSQVKLFLDDPYEYFLHYVAKIPYDIDMNSPYGLIGNAVHDILEQYYNNIIEKEKCPMAFQIKFRDIMLSEKTRRFSNLKSVEKQTADTYQRDIVHYLKNMNRLDGENLTECPFSCNLTSDTNSAAFLGYIDLLNIKDGKYTIIDYKTSTFYKQEDIPKYRKQLLLYAHAVKEKYNLDYKDISIGWNFLKYAKVINIADLSEQIVERSKISEYENDEYLIKDCIVAVDFTESLDEEFVKDMLWITSQIEDKLLKYKETNSDEPYMWIVSREDVFRLDNFCNYSEKLHKPYKNYLDSLKYVV